MKKLLPERLVKFIPEITIVIIVLVIAIVVITLIIPTTQKMRELYNLITAEKARIEQQYMQRQKARRTKENLEVIKANLDTIRQIAVMEGSEIELIEAIESLAEINGVEEKLRLIPKQNATKYYDRQLTVEMTLSGDPRKIGGFLSDLDHLDPYIIVTKIQARELKDSGEAEIFVCGWISWPLLTSL